MSEKSFKIKIKITHLIAILLVAFFILVIFKFDFFKLKSDVNATTNYKIGNFEIIVGNPNASIILIEYSSFECPACRMFHAYYFANIEEAINNGKLKYILRLIPFRQSEFSFNLVKASYCSAKLTNSIDYIKSVYLNFEKIRDIETTFQYFNGDVEEFKKCINSVEAENYLKNSYKKAIEDEIPGTPTFILIKDGKVQKIVGAQRINLDQ